MEQDVEFDGLTQPFTQSYLNLSGYGYFLIKSTFEVGVT